MSVVTDRPPRPPSASGREVAHLLAEMEKSVQVMNESQLCTYSAESQAERAVFSRQYSLAASQFDDDFRTVRRRLAELGVRP